MVVAKLKGARERKRVITGKKVEGRKSHAELRPELVALVRQLRRKRPKGGQRPLRDISAELAQRGHLNERSKPFTLVRLRSRSCIIDGEAVACDETGIARFDRLRNHRVDHTVFMYAFDLIELGGDDLRRDPLEVRKATLASGIAKAGAGIRYNEHLDFDDAAAVFQQACRMGLEGIVSKRKDSLYRSTRSKDWLKMKNPECEAVRREAEEDWGR